MIRKEIIDKLKQYLTSKGWGTTEEDLIELIIEADVVWEDSELDHYRWYTLQETVTTPIEDVYIKFNKFIITGDGCLSDMDLEYNLDDFTEVIPEEKVITTTIYKEI